MRPWGKREGMGEVEEGNGEAGKRERERKWKGKVNEERQRQ